MWTIARKEMNDFFASTIGYVTVLTFLLITGLFTWVFPNTNIFDTQYASLDPFFSICPFLFLFLVPAITMRTFAEERAKRTYELLITKPVTELKVIGGKYIACLLLIIIALIPTLLYFWAVYNLGSPVGNLDIGASVGSYIGLLFLAGAFISVGVFTSSLFDNQIVVFLLAALLIFLLYVGLSFIADLSIFSGNLDFVLKQLSMSYHYEQMSRGLIDLRDVVYFSSVISVFLGASWVNLKSTTI